MAAKCDLSVRTWRWRGRRAWERVCRVQDVTCVAYQDVVIDDNDGYGASSHHLCQAERVVAEAFHNQTKACTWRSMFRERNEVRVPPR
jgi:hypothetical protein